MNHVQLSSFAGINRPYMHVRGATAKSVSYQTTLVAHLAAGVHESYQI